MSTNPERGYRDRSILNEAFAFIEACDDETSPVGVDTTDGSSDLDDVPSPDDLIDTNLELLDVPIATETQETPTSEDGKPKKSKQKPTKKRRVRSAETSSTGLQLRKRAELASLREQVEELQGVLTQLKRTESLSPSCGIDAENNSVSELEKCRRSQWHSHAIDQYRLRLQAEKVNRHLKAIMKNHAKVREALGGVLEKRTVLYVHISTRIKETSSTNLDLLMMLYVQGMGYLKKQEEPNCGSALPLSGISHVDFSMARLEAASERLRLLFESRFETSQQPVSINTCVQCKYDERRKMKTIEFETTTPLNCSLQEASSYLWSDFQSDRTLGIKPDTLIEKVMLTMPSRKGAITAEKLHFMRKYQDTDQTLVTWADIMVLPKKRELQFRTEGIILLSVFKTNPNQAVSRSFLKLYLDVNDASCCELRPEDVAYAQDIVLGAMAMKLRLYWQSFQNMLIEGASRSSNIQLAL